MKQCAQLMEKVCDIKYYVKKVYCSSLIQFSECDISINVLVLNNFGTGFEVLTVVRNHNAVWNRTPYSLVHTWL